MQKSQITIRIIFDALILFFIINGWWYAALPLSLIGLWAFPFYIETMVAGIMYDSLFGFAMTGWQEYLGTIVATFLTFLVTIFKNRIR